MAALPALVVLALANTAEAADPAPAFSLPALSPEARAGQSVRMRDLLETGRPVYLSFVESSCEDCGPAIEALEAAGTQQGLEFVTVWVWTGEAQAAGGANLTLHDSDATVSACFGLRSLPATVGVAPSGQILGVWTEYATDHHVYEMVNAGLLWQLGDWSASSGRPELWECQTEGPRRAHALSLPVVYPPDRAGEHVSLEDVLLGTTGAAHLMFHASDCEPCRESLAPMAAQLGHKPALKPFVVISSDAAADMGVLAADAEQAGVDLVLHDDGGVVRDCFGVRSLPTTLAVDKSGEIKGEFSGRYPRHDELLGRDLLDVFKAETLFSSLDQHELGPALLPGCGTPETQPAPVADTDPAVEEEEFAPPMAPRGSGFEFPSSPLGTGFTIEAGLTGFGIEFGGGYWHEWAGVRGRVWFTHKAATLGAIAHVGTPWVNAYGGLEVGFINGYDTQGVAPLVGGEVGWWTMPFRIVGFLEYASSVTERQEHTNRVGIRFGYHHGSH